MKVAVIGTGFGEKIMAVVWRRLGCEVEVVSPRDSAAVKRACASEVDLVSIHSPPFMHFDHVMLALDNRRNVLCDKPFASNADEARAMRDRARELGVLHFLNFEFRRHPCRNKAKELLEAGAIGKLQHVGWTFFGSGFRNRKFGWLFDRELAGGWLGAFGTHAIDTARFLFDSEVAQCGGTRRTETKERMDRAGERRISTAEDAFSAWFVMEGGGTFSLDTAFSSPVMLPQRINLLGSEGAIEIVNDMELTVIRPSRDAETHSFKPSDWDTHEPALVPWLTMVREAVETGRQITPSFDDGLAVTQVTDALQERMPDATAPWSFSFDD